jgi:hypothetical protein
MNAKQCLRCFALCSTIAALPAAGCQDNSQNCEFYNCNAGGQGGGGGAGGQGGGVLPGCVPSELGVGEVLRDDCGVFVSSSMGDDGNPGTITSPLATLEAALATGKTVYACGEDFALEAMLEVPAGSVVFGALDCAHGWAYAAESKTHVLGAVDVVAVKLASGQATTALYDLGIEAPSAMADGASSIALLADGATAELERCDVLAGNGAVGIAGETPASIGPNGEGTPGDDGLQGTDGCDGTTMLNPGGDSGHLMCGMTTVDGGIGGNGANGVTGGDGSDGQPQPGPMPNDGQNGVGEGNLGQCPGYPGAPGVPGPDGSGASGLPTLDASGYVGANGTSGTAGTPGQGGGGGGGGNNVCPPNNGAGPGGGGGGSGGCGGQAAPGGGPGGASIALLSVDATLTLTDVSLAAGGGGPGGAGAAGQPGGSGGQPGLAGAGGGACAGGQGGQGGDGGDSGGGLGGYSIALAFTGTAPTEMGTTMASAGAPGPGGAGGDGKAALDGEGGLGCARYDATAQRCTD